MKNYYCLCVNLKTVLAISAQMKEVTAVVGVVTVMKNGLKVRQDNELYLLLRLLRQNTRLSLNLCKICTL